jgi:opacity protein-like surface antigen
MTLRAVTHRPILSVAVVVFSLIAFASSASAQDSGFFAGHAGVTFQTATGASVGAEGGVNAGRMLRLFGSINWFQDITPSDVQDQLDDFGLNIDVTTPTTTFMGGVRVGPGDGPFRPYAVAAAGMAHVTGKFEVDGRDVTDEIEDDIGEPLSSNEFVFEFGGGVEIRVGEKVFIDTGYRYMRISADEGEGVNVSRVYGGLGLRF